jgi:hypothetical protein
MTWFTLSFTSLRSGSWYRAAAGVMPAPRPFVQRRFLPRDSGKGATPTSSRSESSKPAAVFSALLVTLIWASSASAQPPLDNLALWLRADADNDHIQVIDGRVAAWVNEVGGEQVFSSLPYQQPEFVAGALNGLPVLRFHGDTEPDTLRSIGFGEAASELTIFLVATPFANHGSYAAFLSAVDASAVGHDDYASGFNIDLGSGYTNSWSTLNLEGAKGYGGGGVNLRTGDDPFGTYRILSITYGSFVQDQLYVNGTPEGSRFGDDSSVSLQDIRVGSRFYDNGNGPYETGYFIGDIAEVLIYGTLLTEADWLAAEDYLSNKYGLH